MIHILIDIVLFLQKNVGQSGGVPGLDLNVELAWAMGFTGKGVTTAIMDDGMKNALIKINLLSYLSRFIGYDPIIN